ncbi:hypothetical protein TWF970_008650 [Orbilia oligospora]|uniref:Uncharacterized protein n=1 Tax=Orbilia oligospora TaxID=2813651 RepID=A0A7C8RMP9_ORBOL|nr:hypothetical protein TWF970_008650 [Orbilia oligospora]
MSSISIQRAGPVLRQCFQQHASVASFSRRTIRGLKTLEQNKKIYIHPSTTTPQTYTLTYLPTTPPSQNLAIGTTTTIPPTPSTFTENPHFRTLLMSTLSTHAANDQDLINEAYGTWGATMGVKASVSKGMKRDRKLHTESTGTPSTSATSEKTDQVDTTSIGGFHHVVDRRTPYYGGMRIPESQDILGSLQVDGNGRLVGGFVECESYRLVTSDGILGLTEYLEGKVKERIEEEEKKEKKI